MSWFTKKVEKEIRREKKQKVARWISYLGMIRLIHHWNYPTEIRVTLDEFFNLASNFKADSVYVSDHGPFIKIGPTKIIAYVQDFAVEKIIDLRFDEQSLADLAYELRK